MEGNKSMLLITEEPFNDSLLYKETLASLNDLTINTLNISWNTVFMMLSDWQKDQLMEVDTYLGVECLLGMWFNHKMDSMDTENVYCNATWDEPYCLPSESVGVKVTKRCYKQKGEITRVCLNNGSWSRGDTCKSPQLTLSSVFEQTKYLKIYVGHTVFIGSIISVVFLCVSLAIFSYFRRIWNKRIKLQIQLMLSLLLRGVLFLLISEPIVTNRDKTYRDNDTACKIVLSLYLYSSVAAVMWMLIQGIHLNKKLTSNVLTDETEKKMMFYYFLGWLFPAGVLGAYLVIMIRNQRQEICWKGYPEMTEIWIILAPILAALSLNAIFVVNILRVVVTKSHAFSAASESSKLVSIAKATCTLFPVLGIHYMFLIYTPEGEFKKYFILLNSFFGSIQGALVSIVYCFMNKDILRASRLSYNRYCLRREFRMSRRPTQRENVIALNLM